MKFKRIIVWGYKNINHTHRYIHQSYYKTFKHMGYETYWVDSKKEIENINLSDTLFFTEGQVCKDMPLTPNAYYVLHNVDGKFHESIKLDHKVNLQFFHKDVVNRGYEKLNEYTYLGSDIIHQPWATDLLPHEFYEPDAHNELNNKECVFIGSYDNGDHSEFQNNTELNPFFEQCRKNNISIRTISPWSNPCSSEENRRLVKSAYLAPAIVGIFQKNDHYIPCRIFKNISYGHMGITNSSIVNHIFDNKLVYDSDPAELFNKAMEKKLSPTMIEETKWLISEVRSKHTFIDRANVILNWFA